MMNSVTCRDFDDFVQALADETRQRILTLLQAGEMSVSELNEHFTTTQDFLSRQSGLSHRVSPVTPNT